jgi:hypothetical protein
VRQNHLTCWDPETGHKIRIQFAGVGAILESDERHESDSMEISNAVTKFSNAGIHKKKISLNKRSVLEIYQPVYSNYRY